MTKPLHIAAYDPSAVECRRAWQGDTRPAFDRLAFQAKVRPIMAGSPIDWPAIGSTLAKAGVVVALFVLGVTLTAGWTSGAFHNPAAITVAPVSAYADESRFLLTFTDSVWGNVEILDEGLTADDCAALEAGVRAGLECVSE